MTDWTHKGLVRRMANWLKFSEKMTVVCAELRAYTHSNETPDVIAWKNGAVSILVECKVSRADFLADSKKCFRRNPDRGMGDYRYMAAPPGIIKPEELPEKWGLLEPTPYCGMKRDYIKTIVEAQYQGGSKQAECAMLMSALRRLEISTAVYVVHEDEAALAGAGEGQQ